MAGLDDLKKAGATAIARGDFDAAITAFAQLIKADPKNAGAYYQLGLSVDGNSGRRHSAITAAVINLNPNYAEAHYRRGLYCKSKGDSEQAYADFTAAINANPDFAPPYAVLSAMYLDRGDTDHALADAEKSVVA